MVVLSNKLRVHNIRGSVFHLELMDRGIMANLKTKWELVREGALHAGESIKWRNRLPGLCGRFKNESQHADMHAALFAEF